MEKTTKYYYASRNHKAKLFVQDGKFILAEGSELTRPAESTKSWKDTSHYDRGNNKINDYLKNEKVKEVDGKIVMTINIAFKSPSAPADLVTGGAENGWMFFKGLDELRN